MRAVVNGQQRLLDAAATVADVVALLGHGPPGAGIAVALNGEVVRRAEWARTRVAEGDRMEILEAAQGG